MTKSGNKKGTLDKMNEISSHNNSNIKESFHVRNFLV